MLPRALNHMAVPGLRYDAFFALAERLGCVGVELRTDLPRPLFGGDAPEAVGDAARARGLRILALAELKPFNDWSDDVAARAEALMRLAVACGAEAISLIPRCDGEGRGNGERQAKLRLAVRALHPMLEAHGLVGLVEPLGFEAASLRLKAEAVEAIAALGAGDRLRLVHDTFHHALAGGGPVFAGQTGLVHISGVTDPRLSLGEMRDGHRGLVDARDRLGSVEQLQALAAAGYTGPVSFEPFAAEVHAAADPEADLARSFAFIASQMAEHAA